MAVSRCKVHSQQVSAKVKKNAKSTHTTLEALDEEATRKILEGQHKKGRYHGNERENRVIYNYAHKECSAVEHGTLKAAVDKALDDHSITKVRKDAVVAESMYCSVPDWREYTEPEEEALVADLRADAESRGLLVVDIRLHLDEATPHLHITSVPIAWDDDRQKFRLAATKLMAYTTAEAMAWQEKMWIQVAEPRGYKRPDLGKSSTKAYVKKTSQEAAAARAEAKAAKEELAKINRRLEVARLLEQSVAECPDRLDRVCELTRERGQAAGERAKVAAASQAELGAEITELRERVTEAERDRDAARRRLKDVARQVRSAMRELGHLPQKVYNSLCDGARRLADKIGLNPTLAGFAGYGRVVSEPSAYEQRRQRGVLAALFGTKPPETSRKPGELKSAPNKPKPQKREQTTPDKDSVNAKQSVQARTQGDRHIQQPRQGR